MKLIQLVIAFVICCVADHAFAQSRFIPDSVSIEYAQCKGDSAQAEVLLINRGSGLEILDLRFADSNRSWEIYDSTGGTSFVKGVLLFGGDTLALKLRQKPQSSGLSHEWYRDTLVTSGAATSDTLLLNARIRFAELHTDLDSVDFGVLPQGGVAAQIFRIWNTGDASHIFTISHSPEWTLQGLSSGDTLAPGDTIEAHFILPGTTPIGTYAPFLTISGDCDDLGTFRGLRVKIAPQFAHWTQARFIDSSTGCASAEDYQVTIRNDSPTITTVDSVRILDQVQQWSFVDPVDKTFMLNPYTSKTLVLRRGINGTSTRLVIVSGSGAQDTLPVTFVPMFSRPRIKNSVDTARLSLQPNEAKAFTIEVQNLGTGLYRLRDVLLIGNPKWSVLGLDTITTVGQSKSLQVTLVFAGAAEDGDYPVQAFIKGAPCDSLLTQVVVASVRSLSVDAESKERGIQVFPTIAADRITLRSLAGSTYEVYDLLGRQVLRGNADRDETLIDVTSLDAGRYFLRVASKGSRQTIAIEIAR